MGTGLQILVPLGTVPTSSHHLAAGDHSPPPSVFMSHLTKNTFFFFIEGVGTGCWPTLGGPPTVCVRVRASIQYRTPPEIKEKTRKMSIPILRPPRNVCPSLCRHHALDKWQSAEGTDLHKLKRANRNERVCSSAVPRHPRTTGFFTASC